MGVSDMRQQLQGMQLMQQRDGSGGGGNGQQAESAAGAVVSESGVVGAASKRASPAEEVSTDPLLTVDIVLDHPGFCKKLREDIRHT